MNSTRNSFSVFLPVLVLASWAASLLVPTGVMYLRLLQRAHGAGGTNHSYGDLYLNIPRERYLSFVFEHVISEKSQSITAMNMPGIVVELLVSLPTTFPDSWYPKQFELFNWRSIAFPFYCLPFWWLVGRGLDSVLGWRRLWLTTILTGFLLQIACLVCTLGIMFGTTAADRREDDSWIFAGLVFWILLFGLLPAAWVRQRLFPTAAQANLQKIMLKSAS